MYKMPNNLTYTYCLMYQGKEMLAPALYNRTRGTMPLGQAYK